MDFIEPCFGIGHNLSLICQMTSEDIKHQLIIIITAPSLRTEQINSKWLSGRDCAGFDGDDDGGDGSVDGDNLLTWYVHLDIDKSYFIG